MLARLAPANGLRDQVSQLAGTLDRRLAAAFDDYLGDAAAVAFFAELPENFGDLRFIGMAVVFGKSGGVMARAYCKARRLRAEG